MLAQLNKEQDMATACPQAHAAQQGGGALCHPAVGRTRGRLRRRHSAREVCRIHLPGGCLQLQWRQMLACLRQANRAQRLHTWAAVLLGMCRFTDQSVALLQGAMQGVQQASSGSCSGQHSYLLLCGGLERGACAACGLQSPRQGSCRAVWPCRARALAPRSLQAQSDCQTCLQCMAPPVACTAAASAAYLDFLIIMDAAHLVKGPSQPGLQPGTAPPRSRPPLAAAAGRCPLRPCGAAPGQCCTARPGQAAPGALLKHRLGW